MMRLRSFKIKRENKHITQAAPGTKCTSLIGIRGYLLNPFRPLVFHSCGNGRARSSLVPVNAPYFDGAKLLIAADCTAYAYARLHEDFMKGKITLIGCPKLDAEDYSEKLTQIIANNDIQSVTIVRMEVPCCGGLEFAAKKALQNSGKFIPWQVITVSVDGKILS